MGLDPNVDDQCDDPESDAAFYADYESSVANEDLYAQFNISAEILKGQ